MSKPLFHYVGVVLSVTVSVGLCAGLIAMAAGFYFAATR